MNPTSQAVIAIRRPEDWWVRRGNFIVRIDGHRAGKVKPEAIGKFTIEPGTHTVAVSMAGWPYRSRSAQVVVEPGSRTELVILGRPDKKAWWKDPVAVSIVFALLIASAIRDIMLDMLGFADANWWVRMGLFGAVYLVLFAGFVLVTSLFAGDYWAMWTLEPVGTSSTQGPVTG